MAQQALKNRRITIDKWQDTYKLLPNLLDDNASWQDENGVGVMYETYGEEEAFVNAIDSHYVWTYDGDYVMNGRHFINRIGYFISSIPWKDEDNWCIKVSSR